VELNLGNVDASRLYLDEAYLLGTNNNTAQPCSWAAAHVKHAQPSFPARSQ
jgi:hypothetical protein